MTDWDSAERLLNSPVAKKVAAEAEQATGVKIAAWYPVGFRNVINNKRPVQELADLAGLKIRLQNSPVHLSTFRGMGANPIAVPWTEVYQAVQTGVVDGLENSLNVLLVHKFYEVAPYISQDQPLLLGPAGLHEPEVLWRALGRGEGDRR